MGDERSSQGQVEPRLSPQLEELRARIRAGTHHGERFEVSVTDRELEEAVAWYLGRRPKIPFVSPRVFVHPHGVEARGEARLGKLHLGVGGQASVALQDGVPVVTIERLELGKAGLPPLVRSQVQAELDKQLSVRGDDLPVIFEAIDLQEGRLAVRGTIR